MTSFNLSTQSAAHTQVIDPTHDPVVRVRKVKADQGTIRYGSLVGLDGDGLVIAWDGVVGEDATSTLYGVAVESCDTAREKVARILVHGTAKADSLWVVDATPALPTTAQLALLEAVGIWANQGVL